MAASLFFPGEITENAINNNFFLSENEISTDTELHHFNILLNA